MAEVHHSDPGHVSAEPEGEPFGAGDTGRADRTTRVFRTGRIATTFTLTAGVRSAGCSHGTEV